MQVQEKYARLSLRRAGCRGLRRQRDSLAPRRVPPQIQIKATYLQATRTCDGEPWADGLSASACLDVAVRSPCAVLAKSLGGGDKIISVTSRPPTT
jgi:hypothetical protein